MEKKERTGTPSQDVHLMIVILNTANTLLYPA
jgi:hypothetical protein